MDWTATTAAVTYTVFHDYTLHMYLCLLCRHLKSTDSCRSLTGFFGRRSIPPFHSDNKKFFSIETVTEQNCSRVVWSLDSSILVFAGEKRIASEHMPTRRVGGNSSPSKGLFFIEVGNSVAGQKLITEDTDVSHVVHSLQTGSLVLVLQEEAAYNCTLRNNTKARRNTLLRGYVLVEGSTGKEAHMCLEVSLQS